MEHMTVSKTSANGMRNDQSSKRIRRLKHSKSLSDVDANDEDGGTQHSTPLRFTSSFRLASKVTKRAMIKFQFPSIFISEHLYAEAVKESK